MDQKHLVHPDTPNVVRWAIGIGCTQQSSDKEVTQYWEYSTIIWHPKIGYPTTISMGKVGAHDMEKSRYDHSLEHRSASINTKFHVIFTCRQILNPTRIFMLVGMEEKMVNDKVTV